MTGTARARGRTTGTGGAGPRTTPAAALLVAPRPASSDPTDAADLRSVAPATTDPGDPA